MLLNKKKRKPVLKFNPGFALIGLQTNRPTRPLVQLLLGEINADFLFLSHLCQRLKTPLLEIIIFQKERNKM